MSQLALLTAVRNVLRQAAPYGLGLPIAQCEVMFDGQPPPVCGELFVAVHPGDWNAVDVEGLEEEFGVDITVTVRVGKVPRDGMGLNALIGPAGASLDGRLEQIRALLHLDSVQDQVLNQANQIIGNSANGFVEPLRFRGCSRPEPKGPDWFGAEANGHGPLPPVGLAQTLHFGGARRVQHIESET